MDFDVRCFLVPHGQLQRAPAVFTADAERAEQTLPEIAQLDADRVLFAHGAEIAQPQQALRALLDA